MSRARAFALVGALAAALAATACGSATPARPQTSAPGVSPAAPTPTSSAAAPRGKVAAYVDVTLADVPEPAPELVLLLAFVTAGRTGCVPTWGGVLPLDDPGVLRRVKRWRAAGHEVRVSFGGARGTDLAERCTDVDELAAAYRRVADTLSPTVLDLDVEGRALADAASARRRVAALRRLQADADRAGRPVRVSFTLPADARGLTPAARAVLSGAHAAGVVVDAVNAMTMNYGSVPADQAGQALTIARSVHRTLRALTPDADSAQVWRRVWVTPMIGRNDVAPQVFTPADADRLAALARAAGLGGLAYWSLSRDRPCTAQAADVPSLCSGLDVPPGTFADALLRFARP